jgi:hypothetical protein
MLRLRFTELEIRERLPGILTQDMYSIINFNVWLSIIDELLLLDTRYSKTKSKWNGISSKLRGLKDTRDRLAHHTARFRGDATMLNFAKF